MHLSEDVLQVYVDGEMQPQEMERVRIHLAGCPACSELLSSIRQRIEANRMVLNRLLPDQEQIEPDEGLFARIHARRETEFIPRKSKWRPLWAAILVIASIVAAMNIKPVRVWATEFLALFRVQQIAVVRFDPANLEQLQNGLFGQDSERRIERLLTDQAHINKRGETQTAQNMNEAAQLAGFGIRMPSAIASPTQIQVNPAVDATFDIDVGRMQEILDEAGRTDIRIPEQIDGEMIRVNVPASVTARFGTCPERNENQEEDHSWRSEKYADCKILVQLPTPVLVAPPSLDVNVLSTEMLRLLGFTKEQARQISESIDWATTFVIPLPLDPRMDAMEVKVDGVDGHLFLSHGRIRPEQTSYNLLWIRDGILYSFMGRGTAEEALIIANSM